MARKSSKTQKPREAEKSIPVSSERKVSPWIAIGISAAALLVSGGSMYQAWQARRLAYIAGQPALKAEVRLLRELKPGEQVPVQIKIENKGQTTARGLQTEVGWAVVPEGQELRIEYPTPSDVKARLPISDLPPESETFLSSVESVSLEHDHDVEAVHSGKSLFHVYGRSTYNDTYDQKHEFHFCGVYRRLPNLTEPLKLVFCEFYNETIEVP